MQLCISELPNDVNMQKQKTLDTKVTPMSSLLLHPIMYDQQQH